jgi:hypothetical protein
MLVGGVVRAIVVFAEKLEGFVGWRASLVDKVVDPLLSGLRSCTNAGALFQV